MRIDLLNNRWGYQIIFCWFGMPKYYDLLLTEQSIVLLVMPDLIRHLCTQYVEITTDSWGSQE